MASTTRNIVPRANGEGSIGTEAKYWGHGYFDDVHATNYHNVQDYLAKDDVYFLFPKNTNTTYGNDCEIIKTSDKTLLIDTGGGWGSADDAQTFFESCLKCAREHDVTHIDYFLLTHYHPDHYENIPKWMSQTDIDISKCQWLLPTNYFSAENFNQVIGYFTATNTSYRLLSQDETLTLSDTCTVDLMCCVPAVKLYAQSKNSAVNNENVISIVALVKHKNVKALLTGDMLEYETDYINKNYSLSKVNLYKVPHHASPQNISNDEKYWAQKFTARICPDYSVYNFGLNIKNVFASTNNPTGLVTENAYENYAFYYGSKMYRTVNDNIIFKSDGNMLYDLNNIHDVIDDERVTALNFWVNINADATLADGTSEHPFKTFEQLVSVFTLNMHYAPMNIMIAAGTYNACILRDMQNEVHFYSTSAENVTIKRLQFYNCKNVFFESGLIVNLITLINSNVMIYNLNLQPTNLDNGNCHELVHFIGLQADKSVVALSYSKLSTHNLTIDDTESVNDKYKSVFSMMHSVVANQHLYIKNAHNIAVSLLYQRASQFYIGIIEKIKNINVPLCSSYSNDALVSLENTDFKALAKLLDDETVTLSHLFESPYYTKNVLINLPTVGTTENRPDTRIVPIYFMYFDITLNKLLVYDGSKWVNE